MENSLLISILFVSGLVLWEHAGRVLKSNFKPSIAINSTIEPLQNWFEYIGESFARISSYLHWLKLDELATTLKDLFIPIVKIFTAPVFGIKGYLTYTWKNFNNPYIIYIGSILLIIASITSFYYFRQYIPFGDIIIENVIKYYWMYFMIMIFFAMASLMIFSMLILSI